MRFGEEVIWRGETYILDSRFGREEATSTHHAVEGLSREPASRKRLEL